MACELFAVTDEASLAYGVQVACGTPATSLISLRYTSESLAMTTEATQSNEIRDDRNVTDLVRTSASVGGAIGFELSYETFDIFFQGLLQSPVPFDGVGTEIKNGKTKQYLTFERNTPAGPGPTNYFTSFQDMQIASLDLQIQQGAPIQGTWTVLGQGLPVNSSTSIDVDGYSPANDNPVYNTVAGVGSIVIDNVEIGAVQGLTLTISNNLREQRALGSVAPAGVANGKFTVTGTVAIYFENNDLASKFINDQSFDLFITLEDTLGTTAGNQITIWLPSVKFGNLTNSVPGINQDVLLEGDFQAIYAAGSDATIAMTTSDAT
jgi:hypothetical protein